MASVEFRYVPYGYKIAYGKCLVSHCLEPTILHKKMIHCHCGKITVFHGGHSWTLVNKVRPGTQVLVSPAWLAVPAMDVHTQRTHTYEGF